VEVQYAFGLWHWLELVDARKRPGRTIEYKLQRGVPTSFRSMFYIYTES
jgi:hypothetical protein